MKKLKTNKYIIVTAYPQKKILASSIFFYSAENLSHAMNIKYGFGLNNIFVLLYRIFPKSKVKKNDIKSHNP